MITIPLKSLEDRATSLLLLLVELLVELINNSNREQDTSSGSNSTHKISNNGQGTDTHTTEGSGSWDISVQFLDNVGVSVTLEHHVLISELLGNILGAASGDLNPSLGEQSTRGQDERDIEECVEGIRHYLAQVSWWGDVVGETANWDTVATHINVLPLSQQVDQEVGLESLVQDLREEEQVGNQGGLQDNWHVRGVEQFDWIGTSLSTHILVLDSEIHSESLEINNNNKN